MKKYISLALLFFVTTHEFAHATPVLKSPLAEQSEFEGFLDENKSLRSHSRYYYDRMTERFSTRTTLFELGSIKDANPEQSLKEIEALRKIYPLSPDELKFIASFSKKHLESGFSIAQETFCHSNSLVQSESSSLECQESIVSYDVIKRSLPMINQVLIEGIQLEKSKALKVATNISYNWTLLSDSHHPIHYFGTYEGLLHQRFEWVSLVSGTCDQFNISSADPILNLHSQIYFSNECVRRAKVAVTMNNFEKKSKKAFWFMGALAAGAIAYSLKDKRITIDVISF